MMILHLKIFAAVLAAAPLLLSALPASTALAAGLTEAEYEQIARNTRDFDNALSKGQAAEV